MELFGPLIRVFFGCVGLLVGVQFVVLLNAFCCVGLLCWLLILLFTLDVFDVNWLLGLVVWVN